MKHVGNLQYITFLKGLAILGVILVHAPQLIKEEFYKLKYCSTVVYMVPRA